MAINMHNGKIPNWLPAIFFSFSKRECEEYARACYKNEKGGAGLCFTTAEEQEAIEQVWVGRGGEGRVGWERVGWHNM